MSSSGSDSLSVLLLVGAVGLVILMAWRGWRLGIVRQTLSLVALGAGYLGGYLFGGYLIPILRPLGFPDRVLTIFGATILGFLIYVSASVASGILFKRTSQQSVGLIRLGFGFSGALLGAGFGVFLVLVCAIAIRLIGSVADAEMHPHPQQRGAPTPTAAARRLAALKHSLESGQAGAFLQQVDPVPEKVYSTLGRVGELAASPQGLERFTNDRQVQHVSAHPKILALRDDPQIAEAVRAGDFFSLLRNPNVIAAANDPEVAKLLGGFDLQKALDQALPAKEKPPSTGPAGR